MNDFALNQIKLFYEKDSRCKSVKCIEETLFKLSEGIFDLDILFVNNAKENAVIKTLTEIFLMKLEAEKNKEFGAFGVGVGFFSDGPSWYYRNQIKSEFIVSKPIYANNIENLEKKVKENGDIWFVFDKGMLNRKVIDIDNKYTKKRNSSSRKKKRIKPKSIERIIRENSKNPYHSEITEEEKDNDFKKQALEKELGLNNENKTYKTDRHEFFR